MRALAALAVLVLVGGCQAPPAEMTEAEISQIEAEIMDWAEGFLAAFDALEPEPVLDQWVQEDLSAVSMARKIASRDDLAELYRDLFAGWTSYEAEWLPGIKTDVIAPGVVFFQGSSRQVTTNPDGARSVARIHFSKLLKKEDGVWKIQRSHVSGGAMPGEGS